MELYVKLYWCVYAMSHTRVPKFESNIDYGFLGVFFFRGPLKIECVKRMLKILGKLPID